MPAPPVTIYVTSLTSQPKVRKHIDLLHRALTALEIPYESFDLAIDEDAKRRWQRAKPTDKVVGLPGYLVGGEWIGTMDDFEDAVETGTLEFFLHQHVEHADASQTIGEVELDRLMREMTDADLDQLVGDLSVDGSAGTGAKAKVADVAKEAQANKAITKEAASEAAAEARDISATKAVTREAGEEAAAEAKDISATKEATKEVAVEAAAEARASTTETRVRVEPETHSPSSSTKAGAAGNGIIASLENTLASATGAIKTAVEDVVGAAGAFADDATGQAAIEAPTPRDTPALASNSRAQGGLSAKVAEVASAAGAFADDATGQSAVEAPSEAVESGPKPGEKTLDALIDETMEKEKEEYQEKKAEEKIAEERETEREANEFKREAILEANEAEAALIRKEE